MDPNATLREIRQILKRSERWPGPDWTHEDKADACLLADLVESLDDWLCQGGFPPIGWAEGSSGEGG